MIYIIDKSLKKLPYISTAKAGSFTATFDNMTNCMIFYIILKEGDLMYKLLIVEDDFIIAKGLQKHFEKYHYDVQYIEDF